MSSEAGEEMFCLRLGRRCFVCEAGEEMYMYCLRVGRCVVCEAGEEMFCL